MTDPASPAETRNATPAASPAPVFPLRDLRTQCLLLFLLAGLLYVNTAGHDYALDDQIVIRDNKYVQSGLSGIPRIFTSDPFEGFFGKAVSALPGGRYRPLSSATFAIEAEIWGKNPGASHLVNALLYALGVSALLVLLRRGLFLDGRHRAAGFLRSERLGSGSFGQGSDLAFVSALLFAVHPIHTEAVANLKGRDELLSFLFLVLTLLLVFMRERSLFPSPRPEVSGSSKSAVAPSPGTRKRGVRNVVTSDRAAARYAPRTDGAPHEDGPDFRAASRSQSVLLAAALVCFFLGLLSKENGLTLLGILPVALLAFTPLGARRIARAVVPFLLVTVVYLALRFAVVGLPTAAATSVSAGASLETEAPVATGRSLPRGPSLSPGPSLAPELSLATGPPAAAGSPRSAGASLETEAPVATDPSHPAGPSPTAIVSAETVPALPIGRGDVLNEPYLGATPDQKYATIAFTLGKYLSLLALPHPLSWDYSYPAIPYVRFTDPRVWVVVLLHVGLGLWALLNLRRRSVPAFAILFYMVSIAIVSNIFVNIGAPMGERLAFQASLGFVVLVAALGLSLHAWLGRRLRYAVPAVLAGLVLLGSAKTIARNAAWRSNETLFLADVVAVPSSSKTNQGAGSALMEMGRKERDPVRRAQLFAESRSRLLRAVSLNPGFSGAFFDLGRLSWLEGDFARAEAYWNEARTIHPRHPLFATYDPLLARHHRDAGVAALGAGEIERALSSFERAVQYAPRDAQSWYDLGFIHQSRNDFAKAVEAYRRSLALDARNAEAWNALGTVYYQTRDYRLARESWEQSLKVEPDNASARKNLQALEETLSLHR